MDSPEGRKEFRRSLKSLSMKELLQRAFLVNLVQRIDTEMACYGALFSDEDEDESSETFAADPRLAGIGLMFQQELQKRSVAKAKLQELPTTEEGENNHANNNATH